jgi:hypothetical protein
MKQWKTSHPTQLALGFVDDRKFISHPKGQRASHSLFLPTNELGDKTLGEHPQFLSLRPCSRTASQLWLKNPLI